MESPFSTYRFPPILEMSRVLSKPTAFLSPRRRYVRLNRWTSHEIQVALLIGLIFGLSILFFSLVSSPYNDSKTTFNQKDPIIKNELIQNYRRWQKKHNRDLEIASKAIIARKSKVLNGNEAYFQRAKEVMALLPEKYKPDPEWIKTRNFPDISILYAPKAGTSQLYRVLSNHPDAERFHPSTKEYCMDHGGKLNYDSPNNETYAALHRFHLKTMNQTSQPRQKTTVNGCLNHREAVLYALYIQNQFQETETLRSIWNRKRFIIMFRDPADLFYSQFNFWTINGFDNDYNSTERKYNWASAKLDYRSPELFHEVILSGNRTKLIRRLIYLTLAIYNLGQSLIEMVGRERILFVKNEDMLPDVIDRQGGLLDQLSKFTNLTRAGFPLHILRSKTNCNNAEANRGTRTLCNSTSTGEGYAVTGNRPMLPETRQLIYIIFSEECKLWAEHFGIVYDSCIRALENINDTKSIHYPLKLFTNNN